MNDGELSGRHYTTGLPVQIQWRNGIITSVTPAHGILPDNRWVAPGLVDLQINGFAGIDFQSDGLTGDDLAIAARALRAAGCTRFFVTLITDEWSRLVARLRHTRELRLQSPLLAGAIAGWHIEGPFLSAEPGFCGAHRGDLMIAPTPTHFHELRTVAGDDPLLVTLSPEQPGALEAISAATRLGITISLGHTNASAELLAEAVGRGATGFTHLGNGCPRELNRHDNILWRVFETSGVTVSLIPDAIHVSPALFRLCHRTLGSERIYYTTDAMSAAGGPPGRYRLGTLELEVGSDQVVRLPGTPNFAGSALTPTEGVRRAAQMLNRSWQEVWPRFSDAPARLVGLRGGLELGAPADFCVMTTTRENDICEWQACGFGSDASPL